MTFTLRHGLYWACQEVSRLSGISIRALHHYDAIGLLRPAKINASGYRLYDDASLERLQSILLFRELDFSLAEIKRILDEPGFDQDAALEAQIQLLSLRRDRLNDLIDHARQMKKQGGNRMDFSAFDTEKLDEYAKEAKKKWGNTEAYREYEQRSQRKSQSDMLDAGQRLMAIFGEMGAIRTLSPDCDETQNLVRKLQEYITANYYTCTNEILQGLGKMYAAGGEMTENINAAGGKGTAEFVQKAIEIFCQK